MIGRTAHGFVAVEPEKSPHEQSLEKIEAFLAQHEATAFVPNQPEAIADAIDDLHRNGFAHFDGLIDHSDVARLIAWSESLPRDGDAVSRRGAPFARRNLLEDPIIRELANDPRVREVVDAILSSDAFAVRAIMFDKTPDANWTVPWHQDRSIALRERKDVAGFGPWSEKAGVVHVQPPVDVLKSMLTVRIHLDACDEGNGPLRVIGGSHESLLDANAMQEAVAAATPVSCCVSAGGAMLMRPLILHASSPAKSARHRRVIHIEYAAVKLPGGLEWRFDA
jgi:ectoine hydroxylase-related dioxygenase (phytanoyl-CoA dioxygenase family)